MQPGLAIMEMPEAAVDENDLVAAREHQVRTAGKFPAGRVPMEPVSVTLGVQDFANQELRFGVLAPDLGHVPAALLRRQQVPALAHTPV